MVYFFCLKKAYLKKKALYHLPFIERGLELCLCRKDQQKLSCRRFSCMHSLGFPPRPRTDFREMWPLPARRRFLPTVTLLYFCHTTCTSPHSMAWSCVPSVPYVVSFWGRDDDVAEVLARFCISVRDIRVGARNSRAEESIP